MRPRPRPRPLPRLLPLALASSLALGGCAGLVAPEATLVEAGPGASARERVVEAVAGRLDREPPASATSEPRSSKPERRTRDRGPSNPRFVAAHYAGGVAGTLVFSTMSYAIARTVGTTGQGLSPVIGALVIAAFAPPILNTTVAWALGRTVAPRRDRFWPAFLVRQVVHLGVFAGAVLGGVDFNKPGHFAAIVVGEAFATSGLATLTAELSRRPVAATLPDSHAHASPLGGPPSLSAATRRPIEVLVPVLEVSF